MWARGYIPTHTEVRQVTGMHCSVNLCVHMCVVCVCVCACVCAYVCMCVCVSLHLEALVQTFDNQQAV